MVVRTFLLTWNPRRFPWDDQKDDLARLNSGHADSLAWSCGNRSDLPVGSRAFLMKLGFLPDEEKGLIGSGITSGVPYPGRHWAEGRQHEQALYVDVEFDKLAASPFVTLPQLRSISAVYRWTPQKSGIEIPRSIAVQLEALWGQSESSVVPLPDQVAPGTSCHEGAVRTIHVNSFERSRYARDACVRHYGPRCAACGIDFGMRYGSIADGFIHVHHLVPLSQIQDNYEVDPVKDLRPVCPNCHAVIHLTDPPRTIDQLLAMIKSRGS